VSEAKVKEVEISFSSDKFVRRLFWACLFIELFIVFGDVFINHRRGTSSEAIQRLFNITREDGLSNWFSCQISVFTALTAGIIALSVSRAKKIGWGAIAAFFAYFSMDDATKFHERIGTAFENSVQADQTSIFRVIQQNYPSYNWQLVFGPVFAAFGLFMLVFLWKELATKRGRILLIAALSLMSIAESLDFFEGMLPPPYAGIASMFNTTIDDIEHYSKTLEEFLEVLGVTFLMVAFMDYLFRNFTKFRVSVKN
jgi:hypothetical protein